MAAFLSHIVTEVIKALGYPGVFFLMTLESVNIPIPSEVVMPFSGFLSLQGTFNFWAVAAAGTLGNVAGSLLSYYLAEWILRIRERYGFLRIVLSESHIDKTNEWFRKYGSYSIFFGRVMPIIRTFISLPAGIGKMNVAKFTALTFLGSLIWSVFLTYVGFFLGSNWDIIGGYFRKADIVVVGVALLAILYFLLKRRKKQASQP